METKFKNPHIKTLGYFTLFGLILLSIVFYKERTIFTDAAFQAFHIIKKGGFKVFHGRFGNILVELLPLLAIKLKLSLKTVLILYSISYPLLFLIIYHIIVKYLKNEYMGMVLVFTFTLIVYDSFYFIQSEFYQGLAVLILYFSIIYRYPKLTEWWVMALVLILIVPLAFYHPLMMPSFFIVWTFFFLRDAIFRHWKYGLLLVLMFVVVILNTQYFSSNYEEIKKGLFIDNLVNHFPNYFAMSSHKVFLRNCVKFYYFFPIILFFTSRFYWKEKRWVHFYYVILAPFGYLMLIHIASPYTMYTFYTEMQYLLLALMVSIPFLYDAAPKLLDHKKMLYVFALLMLIRFASILYNHQPYSNRIAWMEQQLELLSQKYEGNRFVIKHDKELMRLIKIEWAVPLESMLLSSLEHPDSAKSIFLYDGKYSYPLDKSKDKVDQLVTIYTGYPTADFPKEFFNLKDHLYQEIKPEDVIKLTK